jgi:hypothetical protein
MIPERTLELRLPMARGEDVRAAQLALLRGGFLRGEADGVFGPRTREAVRLFQARNGLDADGRIGRLTWARLLGERAQHPWRAELAPFVARLAKPHGPPVGSSALRWRLARAGVLVEGEDGPRRSEPAPRVAAQAWARHRAALEEAARRFAVPVELLLATACAESAGRAEAVREEPGFASDAATPHRVSPGLMQTLISTAREALSDPSLDRTALLDPRTSALAGAAYIRRQALRGAHPTGFDPPLVAIAYNAGSLRPSRDATDPWGLVQTRRGNGERHACAFLRFFNDAMALCDAALDVPSFRAVLS